MRSQVMLGIANCKSFLSMLFSENLMFLSDRPVGAVQHVTAVAGLKKKRHSRMHHQLYGFGLNSSVTDSQSTAQVVLCVLIWSELCHKLRKSL